MRSRLSMLLLGVLLTTTSGCNYLILLGYLIGGPPAIEPDYEALTGNSMTDQDVVVAVACFAPKEVLYNFAHVDREITKYVSYRMHEHKVKTINPDLVQKWLDENPHWDEPDEIGRATGATHVIYIDLTSFTLFEENSHELYRGRSEGVVTVYELDEDGEGEPIYSKDIVSRYPLAAPKDTSEISRPQFQMLYLSRLSEEVGRLFYEHFNGDDIADAT
ncbi:MAG: hypothetical protein ACYTGL_00585 [Planctomycetota bacterium]|jgi:hypothetical protein